MHFSPGRAAVVRGSHAIIEGRAGFITCGARQLAMVALREAQAPRPARDVAPWRSALDEDGDVRRPAADAFLDTDAEVDPWDVGSLEAPSASAAPPSQVRSERAEPAAVQPPQAAGAQATGSFPRRFPRATARPPDPRRVVRSRRDHGRDSARRCCRTRRPRAGECPRPTRIAIIPEGEIDLLADGPRDAPSPRLARLLHALSEGAQGLPVQLRLLVLQELSPSPACATTLEFSTKLALYERPGRANLIRGVYQRFQRLPPRDAESRPASQPALAPAPQPEAWWRRRVVRGAAAAALAILLVFIATAWLWNAASPPPPGPSTVAGPWRARSPRRVQQ